MSSPRQNLEGQRYQKLVVIEWAGWRQYSNGRESTWLCQCDCGKQAVVPQRNLAGGNTKSCGCIIGKHKRTHGGTGTPEFRVWDAMRRRCSDTSHPSYPDYGGRGISVCERWQDFANFLADVGPRPSADHSIDRYPNNDGNYEPGNVRWATRVEQSNNRRSSRLIEFGGESLTLAQWERRVGLKPGMLFRRLEAGWSIEKALSPPRVYRRGVERVKALGLEAPNDHPH